MEVYTYEQHEDVHVQYRRGEGNGIKPEPAVDRHILPTTQPLMQQIRHPLLHQRGPCLLQNLRPRLHPATDHQQKKVPTKVYDLVTNYNSPKKELPKLLWNYLKSVSFTAVDFLIMRKMMCLYHKYVNAGPGTIFNYINTRQSNSC